MACNKCGQFPAPASNFKQIGMNIEKHGSLYLCLNCGQYIEVIDEERSYHLLDIGAAKIFYELR